MFGVPCPRLVFLRQDVEGLCNRGKIRNEVSVEIAELYEAPHFSQIRGGGPLVYSLRLGGVHLSRAVAYNDPEEVRLVLLEQTFLQLKV